jgi:large subunit ribosomal protein L35
LNPLRQISHVFEKDFAIKDSKESEETKDNNMKMKTKKAAAKRFSFTATGKVKFKRAGKRHMLGHKSSANKLKLRKGGIVFKGDVQHIVECLPYGSK